MSGYSPTVWVDGSAPALSAANLNKLELGLTNSLGYDTAADLRAAGMPTAVQTALTRGYWACGDGGHGIWRWDAASTLDDPVHLIPTGHVGAGRWVLFWAQSSGLDLRALGMTTDLADATANVAALRAACQMMSAAGGGELYVPCLAEPWPVNAAVMPWHLDRMTIRGPGRIHIVSGGDVWYPAAIFYGGTYGPGPTAGLVYEEPSWPIADASAGDTAITFSTPADADHFSVGDLCLVRDGRYALIGVGNKRYNAPHVREVRSIDAGVLILDIPLSMDVGNSPAVHRLNTGTVVMPADAIAGGATQAYLSRDFRLECDLSQEYSEDLPFGMFNPNLSYRGIYRGRFSSAIGIVANMQCRVDIDAHVTSEFLCWDPGYASEGARVRIVHDHYPMQAWDVGTRGAGALVYMGEGTHHCDVEIKTIGSVANFYANNLINATQSHAMKVHLDVHYPDFVSTLGGLLTTFYAEAFSDGDVSTGTYFTPTDLELSGRVRVKQLKWWGDWAAMPDTSLVTRRHRLHDLELVVEDDFVDPAIAWDVNDSDDIRWERVRAEKGNMQFLRPGGWEIRDCYFPSVNPTMTSELSGYDRWIDNSTLASAVLNAKFDRSGQLNRCKGSIIAVSGGLLVWEGPLYSARGTTAAIADSETVTIRSAAQLGNSTSWMIHATSDIGDAAGVAIVGVSSAGVVTAWSVHASALVWGADSGAGVTITNPIGAPTSISVRWNAIRL